MMSSPLAAMMVGKLLTAAEVAALLQVPKSWIYQRISDGSLPFPYLKVGHFLRFPEDALNKYITEQLKAGQQRAEARRRQVQT
jgi:excisionase family DNA binding protein